MWHKITDKGLKLDLNKSSRYFARNPYEKNTLYIERDYEYGTWQVGGAYTLISTHEIQIS